MTRMAAQAPGLGACARGLLVALLGTGALLGLPACSLLLHSSGPCMSPGYTLDSRVVAPGGTLRVSAPAATCNPRYGEAARVRIDLVNARQEILLSELAPMSDDGAFNHVLKIPATLMPGTYGISAAPDSVDWCDDTGHNNWVENPDFGDTGLGVVRAACAMPHVAFRVTG